MVAHHAATFWQPYVIGSIGLPDMVCFKVAVGNKRPFIYPPQDNSIHKQPGKCWNVHNTAGLMSNHWGDWLQVVGMWDKSLPIHQALSPLCVGPYEQNQSISISSSNAKCGTFCVTHGRGYSVWCHGHCVPLQLLEILVGWCFAFKIGQSKIIEDGMGEDHVVLFETGRH